jgi:hypothetical protein
MASSIDQLFLRIAIQARETLENEIVDHFDEIGDYISSELDPSAKPSQDFFNEWQIKLKVLDAAGFFLKQFESASDSRMFEYSIKKSKQYDYFLECVQSELRRGVVYIVWKKSPQEIHYIGKAGFSDRHSKVKRLTDQYHKNLTDALHASSTLSFLIPTNEYYLSQLEASCIRLLNWYEPNNDLFNRRSEDSNIPKGEYSRRLDLFADRLEELAAKIRRLQWGKDFKSCNEINDNPTNTENTITNRLN